MIFIKKGNKNKIFIKNVKYEFFIFNFLLMVLLDYIYFNYLNHLK